ncbi:hypothetical protein [Actinokineospora sp.]|uniref:hypothetical protein n=1 Tax=Actinokineospora sp. TaxID=1872133 RepID=UPI003D6A8D15
MAVDVERELDAATPEQVEVASLLAGLGRELPKFARDVIVRGKWMEPKRWVQLARVLEGAARLCEVQGVAKSDGTDDPTTRGA